MKNKVYRILLLVVIFTSCKKEEVQFNFSISNIAHEGNGILLEWDKIHIDDFKYYEVLRSVNGSYFKDINNIDKFFDIDKTAYIDYSYPLGDKIYYKISAVGDKKVFVSKTVSINAPEPVRLSIQPSTAYIIPDKSQVLFFMEAWKDSRLYLFDYMQNKIVAEKKLNIKSTGSSYGFGKYEDSYEFYFDDGEYGGLQIFEAHSLKEMAIAPLSTHSSDVITNNNGNIYFSSNQAIINHNRKTLQTDSYSVRGFSFDHIQYSEKQNCIYGTETHDPLIAKLELDLNGNIINHTIVDLKEDAELNFIPNSDLVYYTEYNWDSWDYSLRIINLEDWAEYSLLNEYNDTVPFSTFYAKDEVLYAAGGYSNLLYCYSIRDKMSFIKMMLIRLNPQYLFIDNENFLILIESLDFNDNLRIDKMKLE